MEISESWGIESVTSQLNEGIKLTNKLKEQLHNSNSSHDCGFLIEKIVSCYDNALALLNHMNSFSTTFVDFYPKTEVFDHNFKDHVSAAKKKRKSLARWREVHVCSKTKYEGEHEDEYNWRKYGQKDILGATHPRSYYRCTHRRTRGCLATKQVQRGEDDSRILNILYRGKHTCGVVKEKKENDVVSHEYSPQVKQHENVAPILPSILSKSTSESSCFSNLNNFNIDQSFLDSDSFAFGDIYHLLNDFEVSEYL